MEIGMLIKVLFILYNFRVFIKSVLSRKRLKFIFMFNF